MNDGQVLRDDPRIHLEISEYLSPTEVVVLDCQLADQEAGVFDAETGTRTNLIPPIEPDQRDALQITMRLEGGSWKVADVQASRNFECGFAPTELGLPVVPPAEEQS